MARQHVPRTTITEKLNTNKFEVALKNTTIVCWYYKLPFAYAYFVYTFYKLNKNSHVGAGRVVWVMEYYFFFFNIAFFYLNIQHRLGK